MDAEIEHEPLLAVIETTPVLVSTEHAVEIPALYVIGDKPSWAEAVAVTC